MGIATVSLLIGGASLDPQCVTTAIGLSPTESRRARDPSLRRALGDRAWGSGQWSLVRKDVSIDDIAVVVQELADVYQRGGSSLSGSGAEHQHISVGLFDLRGLGEMLHFDPPLLARMATLGLTLVIDAYGSSPEDQLSE